MLFEQHSNHRRTHLPGPEDEHSDEITHATRLGVWGMITPSGEILRSCMRGMAWRFGNYLFHRPRDSIRLANICEWGTTIQFFDLDLCG
jgi:hypothetical protein